MAESATKQYLTEIRIRDPLADVTRKERKTLLAVSLVGLFMAKTGLLPAEISALGVKFDVSDQKVILNVLALIIAYFVVGFALYAASDFLAWRFALQRTRIENRERRMRMSAEERDNDMSTHAVGSMIFSLSRPVSVVRATFEFLLPVVFAAYAVAALLTTEPPARPTANTSNPAANTQPTDPGKLGSAAQKR